MMDESENIKTSLDEAQKTDIPPTTPIQCDFFQNTSRKHIAAITSPQEITLKTTELTYELKSPHYIASVCLFSTSDLTKEVLFKSSQGGTTVKIVASESSEVDGVGKYIFRVNRIVTGFTLQSDTGLFGRAYKPKISKIEIFGLDGDSLEKAVDVYSTLESTKSSVASDGKKLLDKIEQSKAELKTKIDSATSELSDLNLKKEGLLAQIAASTIEVSNIGKQTKEAQDELSVINSKVTQASSTVASLNSEIETKTSFKSEKESEISSLTDESNDLKNELRTLHSNRNLFTDELSSYAKEGNANIIMYTVLSIAPMAVICWLSYELIVNAQTFAIANATATLESAAAAVISRLPYAFVAASILFASLKIAYFLFSRIFGIHSERLALSEVAIIAKDISDTAGHDIEMSDEARYENRIRLKMALLKRHLSKKMDTTTDIDIKIDLSKADDESPAANQTTQSS